MSQRSARDGEGEAAAGAESDFESFQRRAERVGDEVLGPPLPKRGHVIGEKYRIEELLGRGGMGAVFRATHLVSEKPVAVKWMLRSTSDEHARRRFLREARVAGKIDHPNVVDVYDVGEQGDCGYLVMELLRGESLRARLERGPLSVSEAAELLIPAMHGVSAVHQAGVVHRDLKPDNIFLCEGPDGCAREAKVLDFGISAVTATDPNDPTLTKDGALLGTPAYMSPEQLQSSRDADARSDVYSFGVILYEALTGQLPFEAPSHNALVLAIVHREPKPLAELRPELPRALCELVMRALAKQPAERFQTVDALSATLAPYATVRGSDAGASIPAPEARAPQAKRASAVAFALLFAIVAAGAAYLLRDRDEQVKRPSERPSAPPSAAEPAKVEASLAVSAPVPARVAEAPAAAARALEPAGASAALVIDSVPKASAEQARAVARRTPKPAARASASTPPRIEVPVAKQRSGRISIDDL